MMVGMINTNRTKWLSVLCIASMASMALLKGCKREEAPPSGSSPRASLPPDFFADKEPPGAKSVEEAKKSAKVGETMTIRGRVGGSKEPFVEGRAIFTIMGPGIKPCGADSPMPECKTPWDYCCELPEDIAAHSAVIQVVDAGGSPLRLSLRGQHKVMELSELVVVGRVKQIEKNLLVINATKIFVH